jgi:hypothetical protein
MSRNPSSPKHNIIDAQPPAATFESFTLFPKLSVEIRLKIWRLSFPNSRKVEFRWVVINPFDMLLAAVATNPITLYVNQESREETLRFYEAAFQGIGDGTIYMNPDSDTFINPPPQKKRPKKPTTVPKYGSLYRDTLTRVQWLEIDNPSHMEGGLLLKGIKEQPLYQDVLFNDLFDNAHSLLTFFPNLKNLKLVESESHLPQEPPYIRKVKLCYQNDPGRFEVEEFLDEIKDLLEIEKQENPDFHIPDIELQVLCDCKIMSLRDSLGRRSKRSSSVIIRPPYTRRNDSGQ